MTDLQLECMRLWADKTLSFGCILKDQFRYYYVWAEDRVFCYVSDWMQAGYTDDYRDEQIIWHPITWWRLCYLRRKLMEINKNITDIKTIAKEVFSKEERVNKARMCIDSYFFGNPSLYNQTILERPEELQLLIKDFLISIQ